MKSNTPQVVSGVYQRIQECLRDRENAEKMPAKLEPPCLLSKESMNNYKKKLEAAKENYLQSSLCETWHMKLLIVLINTLQIEQPDLDIGGKLEKIAKDNPLDPMRAALLDARAEEEEEAERKEKKTNKELDGQLSLFETAKKDDGSEAEPASEVTTTKVDPASIDEMLAQKDKQLPAVVGSVSGEVQTSLIVHVNFAPDQAPQQEEEAAQVEVTDVTEQWDEAQRVMIHEILTPGEYDELCELYKRGHTGEANKMLNGYLDERKKKGKNKLFQIIKEDLSALLPQPEPQEEAQPAEEELTELEKKAKAKKEKRAKG